MTIDKYTLLKEAGQIESTQFWKNYVDRVRLYRESRKLSALKRGDTEYEKGQADALDWILGKKDSKSLFDRLRESIQQAGGSE